MIVRRVPQEILLIRQPDHAALAADVLERWDTSGFLPGSWRSILLYATRQHDNGWLEHDAVPTVDGSGSPHDFVHAPEAVRQSMWPRAAARLAEAQPLVGALIAQHAATIYDRFLPEAAWSSFFTTLAGMRDRWLELEGALEGPARESFDRAYDCLRLADLASLVFCNAWTDVLEDRGLRFILSGQTLTIAPDPFRGAIVDLRVRARVVPDRKFMSDDDLRQAIAAAPHRWITGTAVGG